MKFSRQVVAAAVVLATGAKAFSPPSATQLGPSKSLSLNDRSDNFYRLYSSPANEDDYEIHDDAASANRRLRLKTFLQRKSKPVTFAVASAAGLLSCLPGQSLVKPLPAQASAPIVLREALPKDDPPMVQAMTKAKELKKKKSMEEFDAFMQKCNDIEDKQGKSARDAYEKQYNADKEAKAAQKVVDLEKLKRDLLDEGKDPFTFLDAEREVFLFEHDVDLAKVPGTPHNEQLIKEFRSRGKNKPTYENQQYIVKCQVADLKARGVDPLEHFSQQEVMDKTRSIYYKMKEAEATKIAEQYKELMEQYGGRLSPAKEGEVPFVKSGAAAVVTQTANVSKEQLAAEKVAAKEKRAQEKAAAKAKRAAEKEAKKKEKEAQKLARAEEKAQAKATSLEEKQKAKEEASKIAAAAAVAAASSSAHMASDSEIAATAGMDFSATAGQEAGSHSAIVEQTATDASQSKDIMATIKQHATKGNIAKAVVIGGVASYGINYVKENNPATKAERQRQLDLLMGVSDEDDEEDEFDMDEDEDSFDMGSFDEEEKPTAAAPQPVVEDKLTPPPAPKAETPKPKKKRSTAPAPEAPKPKKKFGFFKKKSANDRETDINALISADAEAPEFASLLAKVLTFGAPGRFPAIASMGDMPFDKFDLEKAKEMLIETRSDLDLSDEKSAEVFANVVNCMIIDIVDLASGALKAKDTDDKLAVDAINVVMDFCDHAASLFDAVAQDVEIKPVTYGGNLKKKDLEQMFSKYAGSSMMSMIGGGASQDRVDTLQIILGISDKKAEGLMQKHMMKMMMNLMKDGGKGLEGMPGMEGMEDMMKAMGGEGGMEEMMKAMGGIEGMPGMNGEMSPEDLKQTVTMMKELMDSGAVSEAELADIRKQFKDMYGSDIGDLIKQADQEGAAAGMGEDEKELLDMFKRILGE